MNTIDGYETTIRLCESRELFYAPCFIENKHLYMLDDNGKPFQLGFPVSWLGNNLTVIKTRPRKVIQ